MFKHKPSANEILLEDVIHDALMSLKGQEESSEEYASTVAHLTALDAIQNKNKDGVSKDVMVTVAANLLGILLIVGHERAHVLTSKAIPFVKNLW